jgi:thiol:disulfide interchange protein
VFVDFTAAWCVTCQYNKRTTLADAAVLDDLAARQVALLRADWTRRDPAITAELARWAATAFRCMRCTRTDSPRVLSEI